MKKALNQSKNRFNRTVPFCCLKAGDIVAVQNSSITSKLIRIATRSDWSHVGIATSSSTILEATKQRRNSPEELNEVREVSLDDFINGSTKSLHLVRPESLSEDQIEALNNFLIEMQSKNYTALHAFFTAVPSIVTFWITFTYLCESVRLGIITLTSGGNILAFIIAMAVTAGFIFTFIKLLRWSARIKVGVKKTEQIFYKTKLGRFLVDKKYDMFCSKLVLLADKAIGGPLQEKFPYEEEVQPRHIVEACFQLGWLVMEKENNAEFSRS